MNKTVVLTGGATGVGAASAERLAERGAEVIVLDIKRPLGGSARYIPCDMGDRGSIDAAVAEMPSPIDALVNVAGIPGPQPGELVIRVNFLGLRHLSERLLPSIRDGGTIVNVASTAGREWMRRIEPINGLLETRDFESGAEWCRINEERWAKDPYTFSKQCVVAYSLRAAGYAVGRRVRVNCVSPGAVETQLTSNFRDQIGHEQFDWSVAQMGRMAQPKDIAEVVEFLAVGECGWLNGVDIWVDGGFTAGILSGWINVAESPAARARAAKNR